MLSQISHDVRAVSRQFFTTASRPHNNSVWLVCRGVGVGWGGGGYTTCSAAVCVRSITLCSSRLRDIGTPRRYTGNKPLPAICHGHDWLICARVRIIIDVIDDRVPDKINEKIKNKKINKLLCPSTNKLRVRGKG